MLPGVRGFREREYHISPRFVNWLFGDCPLPYITSFDLTDRSLRVTDKSSITLISTSLLLYSVSLYFALIPFIPIRSHPLDITQAKCFSAFHQPFGTMWAQRLRIWYDYLWIQILLLGNSLNNYQYICHLHYFSNNSISGWFINSLLNQTVMYHFNDLKLWSVIIFNLLVKLSLRLTVGKALQHPWLGSYRVNSDELSQIVLSCNDFSRGLQVCHTVPLLSILIAISWFVLIFIALLHIYLPMYVCVCVMIVDQLLYNLCSHYFS